MDWDAERLCGNNIEVTDTKKQKYRSINPPQKGKWNNAPLPLSPIFLTQKALLESTKTRTGSIVTGKRLAVAYRRWRGRAGRPSRTTSLIASITAWGCIC